jgi:hypothetical protein
MKQIKLTKGQVSIVDDMDFEYVTSFGPWYSEKNSHGYYAVRATYRRVNGELKKTRLYLSDVIAQRFLGELKSGFIVDHINHDSLDNTRGNLRFATQMQNRQNSRKMTKGHSKFKGVTWDSSRNKWKSSVMFNGTITFLGRFDSEEEAAAAYESAAKKLFGEFYCTESLL